MKQSIDVIKLYTLGSQKGWNEFLTKCYNNLDINSLARVMRELQIGMSEAATKKITDEKIEVFYLRLIRSLEITAKRIIKIKHYS